MAVVAGLASASGGAAAAPPSAIFDASAPHVDIESLGPGLSTAWLRAGRRDGISAGESYLCRAAGGQPVARLDVRLVDVEFSFCAVTPLVADLALAPGQRAQRWSGAGGGRAETVVSAVVYVRDAQAGRESTWMAAAAGKTEVEQIIWIAAPPASADLPEPRFDVHRAGEYVAHALVERRDERFWYARTMPAASAGPVRVGDDVRVRLPWDCRRGRLTARVFETAPQVLINAGELDGLTPGETATIRRDGRVVAGAVVADVQPTYAVLLPAARPTTNPAAAPPAPLEAPARLDEVHFESGLSPGDDEGAAR